MAASNRGFSMIELLIAVAIVAILAGVAYPAYTEYSKKTRRSEIAALLVEEAQRLERFHSRAAQYADVIGPPAHRHEVTAGNGFYAIEAERSEDRFVLVATPSASALMAGDRCGAFVLENTGKRDNLGMSSDASVQQCWGR